MFTKAKAKYLRISPRKARLVIDLVRGKNIRQAIFILDNLNKKGSIYVKEVIMSAFGNAKRIDKNITENDLVVSKIFADGGPILKRFRAASMGRASRIKKRTAHICVELDKIISKKDASLLKDAKSIAKTKKTPAKKVEEKSKKKEIKKKLVGAK